MLDLKRLRRVRLRKVPLGQVFMAEVLLRPDYRFPRRTEIVLEGIDEHLERGRGYIFAMNHTDRYNYWPFQWRLRELGWGYTATWVKGKYYESPLLAAFMDAMNNIPMPSRGYVIASRFRRHRGRPPTEGEYRVLRDLVDGRRPLVEGLDRDVPNDVRAFVGADPAAFLEDFERTFADMIREVVRLCRYAFDELHQHLLIFPEGTRSLRLGRGRSGIAQIAQHLRAPIVPVGCNGSDRIYPGNAPFSKGGRVVYRVGPPIEADDPALTNVQVPAEILPFTREAAQRYGDRYQGITDHVMSRIEELLDARHRPEEGVAGTEVQGVARFL